MEVDSIYSKLITGKYATQENKVLKEALSISNQKVVEQQKIISILKTNENNYQLLNENYTKMQENLYRIIEKKDQDLKNQKKKKWKYLATGILIGAGTGIILII